MLKRAQFILADLPPSFVVFLVALPLCMGIAIASGVPPALGIVTGIIGGIVVGSLAGAPLQVSGPAAGLTVLVFDIVNTYGLKALGPVVFVSGLVQVIAGSAKIGPWFRAVNPAVIYGMLSGIGVLILSSQLHIAFDSHPGGSPLENLLLIPDVVSKVLTDHTMLVAGGLSFGALFIMIIWPKIPIKSLNHLPAPLVAIVFASLVSYFFALDVNYVKLPASLPESLNIASIADWKLLLNGHVLAAAIGLSVIASAETLLCASALKKMKSSAEVHYNKELIAQGFGNVVCGLFGALPMTGVIVRSNANVTAGAKGRSSSILHGVWLLVFVALVPELLHFIPMATLAAILIYTGFKLFNPFIIKDLAKYGQPAVYIYLITLFGIVFIDLLMGVALGVAATFVRLLKLFSSIEIQVEDNEKEVNLTLKGAATFITLPKIAEALEAIPLAKTVHVHFDSVFYIDHACMDLIESQIAMREKSGGHLNIDSSKLKFAWENSEKGKIHVHNNKLRESTSY